MSPTKLTAVALAVLLAVGCSGDDSSSKNKDDAQSSSAEFTKPKIALDVKRAELVSPHKEQGALEGKTKFATADLVQKLLLVTSADPLTSGKPGKGFADLFTPDAGARAAGVDRATIFDEGLPSFGQLKQKQASVVLTGLAGTMDPKTSFVVAHFTWDVGSTQHPGDRVVRSGDLSLIPVDGHWRVAAYDITVTRTIADETTTTTAKTGTTKP